MAVRVVDLQLLYGVAGARDKFEQLSAHLIHSEFPDATAIRVHRGDGGIDVYQGEFTGSAGIHVFQAKFFPNGLGQSQRQEVKESFKRCRTNTDFTTRKWTLCLPVDLSVEETKWFSDWTQSEAIHGIDIDWWGATKLGELLYRIDNRGIKEAFFQEEHLLQIREMHGMLKYLVNDSTTRLSETVDQAKEVCKNFREERLKKIREAEEVPLPISNAPKLVLHILSPGVFNQAASPDISLLMNGNNRRLLEPLRLNSGDFSPTRYNADGLLTFDHDTYLQVFRSGIIEAVDTSILSASGKLRFTRGYIYETRLQESLKRYLSVHQLLGVQPPFFIMVSLLGVKDYCIVFNHEDLYFGDHKIGKDDLLIPEIIVNDYYCVPAEVMKPIFDLIANAAGWARSMTYDEDGKPSISVQ